jgi:uncharacterized protein YhfF
MDPRAKDYFNRFKSSIPAADQGKLSLADSYYFCADEKSANHCADLVLQGEKRATAGLKWSYEAEGESLPETGQLTVITNWDGVPQCIVEVTAVEIMPFNKVSANFAYEEGEGDKSLDFWRRVHWEFFSQECEEIGKTPSQDMEVVLEKFKVIWKG